MCDLLNGGGKNRYVLFYFYIVFEYKTLLDSVIDQTSYDLAL